MSSPKHFKDISTFLDKKQKSKLFCLIGSTGRRGQNNLNERKTTVKLDHAIIEIIRNSDTTLGAGPENQKSLWWISGGYPPERFMIFRPRVK